MGYDAKFRVWRGDDESGALHDFTVEVNEGEVVLDVIHRLQATQAPDLAVRWNCKAGKCGSCSAEVNGRPRLMCMTRMSTLADEDVITVSPVRAFPVIRDLVTDVSYNYEKARAVPSFSPPQDLAPGEYRMAQVDVERSQEFRKCIECFLCNNTCHVIRDHEENKKEFSGPRFLMRIAELSMHPLDTMDRAHQAQDEHGLGYCNITKCCTEVCPEHIKITDNALIPMKERVADAKYDPIMILGSKIPTRSSKPAAAALAAGNPEKAAKEAQAVLANKPSDSNALGVLADAQAAQGDYAAARDTSRRRLAAVRGRGKRRFEAVSAHLTLLLDGMESGAVSGSGKVADEGRNTLAEAQALQSTGSVLNGQRARLAVATGDYPTAAAALESAREWNRSDQQKADDLLTEALLRHAQDDTDGAAAAMEQSKSLWPNNPRLSWALSPVVTAD
jgi:succinate dehydrogenase / fumarate reductase iron-sulfur subunit